MNRFLVFIITLVFFLGIMSLAGGQVGSNLIAIFTTTVESLCESDSV